MRISDWSSDVCSSDLGVGLHGDRLQAKPREGAQVGDELFLVGEARRLVVDVEGIGVLHQELAAPHDAEARAHLVAELPLDVVEPLRQVAVALGAVAADVGDQRSEEHQSDLQSLMRISYAVFCLKK